ncbi:unnamed protein product [Ceratitis capitata]|uniref:(Mediterranean fruit fly) hypothetical protein n=1 Tax=Ceratitis capitata TaxID=7213 RepID=A0A811VIL7_CERCA|nr:unnamed protein product [Ceratitis capitata]
MYFYNKIKLEDQKIKSSKHDADDVGDGDGDGDGDGYDARAGNCGLKIVLNTQIEMLTFIIASCPPLTLITLHLPTHTHTHTHNAHTATCSPHALQHTTSSLSAPLTCRERFSLNLNDDQSILVCPFSGSNIISESIRPLESCFFFCVGGWLLPLSCSIGLNAVCSITVSKFPPTRDWFDIG